MSENLFIASTRYTTEVLLDKENRQFSVSGNCVDGDAAFFAQALKMLDKAIGSLANDELFTINIKLSTFEDRTIPGFFYPLFEMCEKYKSLPKPKDLAIKWFYNSKNPDLWIKEAGEEYEDIYGIGMEIIPY